MRQILSMLSLAVAISLSAQTNFHDFTMLSLDGHEVPLSDFEGKTVLVVNTASKCGLTPQYEELQALWEELKDEDFVILGFPANNFLGQEPGTDEEIAAFCQKNYGVSFHMFSKISVKGADQHPLYAYLTSATPHDGNGDVPMKWNFQKFLVGADGEPITWFTPKTSVTDPAFRQVLAEAMGGN